VAAAALQGDPDTPAIVTAVEARPRELIVWPLRRLRSQAARVAWALKAAGVCPGQAVGLVLPLTADAVAVYLGIVLAVRSTPCHPSAVSRAPQLPPGLVPLVSRGPSLGQARSGDIRARPYCIPYLRSQTRRSAALAISDTRSAL
jgi:hypothetical protein